jgi:hypothetical protein
MYGLCSTYLWRMLWYSWRSSGAIAVVVDMRRVYTGHVFDDLACLFRAVASSMHMPRICTPRVMQYLRFIKFTIYQIHDLSNSYCEFLLKKHIYFIYALHMQKLSGVRS